MERCLVVGVLGIDIGAMIKKELDTLMIAAVSRTVKTCAVIVVASIDIGMSIKKELDALMMATQ